MEGDVIKDAAVKAGLGIIGKNNLLVTPRYGPRVRLTVIFTDAEIESDKEISEDFCSNCNLCIKSCPTGALSENGFTRDKCIAEFDPSEEILKLQRKKKIHNKIYEITMQNMHGRVSSR